MKRIVMSILALIVSAATAVAQDAATVTTPGFWDDPFNDPMFPLYAVTTFVFVVIVLVLVVALYMLRILNMLVRKAAEEKAAKLGITYVPELNAWQRFWNSINAFVPVEKEETIELDHNYDGIKELDNHLPPWWKWLFYATIAWSVVYMVMYHITFSLPLSGQEYENQVAEAASAKQKFLASQPATVIDENALVFSADAAIIGSGKEIFTSNNCQSCHRADGGGNAIGPNLTDAYWIHGGDIKSIFVTIKNGVVEKGMPAWGKVMSPKDVRDVTFYVMSLQGTNPVNAKAPQGQLYQPENPTTQTDSLNVQASL
ncbi:MAG: c-type cytochrome [Cyclobacteriaceae bacterium]|nr:c-type cytochrome [Cyclobacteriaceae bacterium]